MGNFATASRRESDPFPQSGLGAYKGTLWDPAAKIAPGQVARNSNLKFGVRPRAVVRRRRSRRRHAGGPTPPTARKCHYTRSRFAGTM